MAGNELTINGLEEFRAALRNLPAELVGEADGIVRGAATAMLEDVLATYPTTGTGNLARGLSVEGRSDASSAVAVVRSRARHAWLYEHGSRDRHWKNGKSTGSMPAADKFARLAVAHRRAMMSALVALLERAGMTVTGSAT